MTAAPKPGDMSPQLTLPSTNGDIKIPSATGRGQVIFFYPKDNTPGCTTEASDFSALKPRFDAAGYDIVGISRDSLASHEKFVEKHGLSVILASDEEGQACEAFGTWVEKSMYGRKFMGIERSTFLIGPDGTIRETWRKVKVKAHAEAVLNKL